MFMYYNCSLCLHCVVIGTVSSGSVFSIYDTIFCSDLVTSRFLAKTWCFCYFLFIALKASQSSSPQLNENFSLDSSLMGSDSSDSLAENFGK